MLTSSLLPINAITPFLIVFHLRNAHMRLDVQLYWLQHYLTTALNYAYPIKLHSCFLTLCRQFETCLQVFDKLNFDPSRYVIMTLVQPRAFCQLMRP
jgi:hypothetical protein